MKKVALIVAHDGYKAEEYNYTKEVLISNGIKVITVSTLPGLATASNGDGAEVDMTLGELQPALVDGVFLIGGPGALKGLDNAQVHQLMKNIAELGKPYGAICISPRILAHIGLLKNKRATGWNQDHELTSIFERSGVHYVNQPVVIDGNIVTATGPEAAEDFGSAISSLLK